MQPNFLLQALYLVTSFGIKTTLSEATRDPAPFDKEHPGQVFNNGKPTGQIKKIDGVDHYLSYPPGKHSHKTDTAILFLSDIFGLPLVNNKLLGDSLAHAGYFVVIPDLFNGDAVPENAMGTASFNFTAWREKHPPAAVDAIVESTIKSMRGKLRVKKIGAVGYCFGGKFVARFLAAGKGIDAGFTAHPSNVVASEWQGIAAPVSIAFGELDGSSTPEQRAAAEAIFQRQNQTFQTSLYSNAEHGFAVRTNLTDPQKRYAQRAAFYQAVSWFDFWIKGN